MVSFAEFGNCGRINLGDLLRVWRFVEERRVVIFMGNFVGFSDGINGAFCYIRQGSELARSERRREKARDFEHEGMAIHGKFSSPVQKKFGWVWIYIAREFGNCLCDTNRVHLYMSCEYTYIYICMCMCTYT